MKQSITFAKMHGLGNDFMVIDAINQTIKTSLLPIAALADRHTGIGFDQLLLIKPAKKADFYCQIFNADGSEAEQCGNGLRCVARFIKENALTNQSEFKIETISGIYPVSINGYNHITITMGAPTVINKNMELVLADGQRISSLSILSIGNPHAIITVPSMVNLDVSGTGSQISTHAAFPAGINVGFMEIVNPRRIRLRTYERGSGETLACGSNACAAVVTGITQGLLENQVGVEYQHGKLTIEWEGNNNPAKLSGPAELVFTGEVNVARKI